MTPTVAEYFPVLIFFLMIVAFAVVSLVAASLVRPSRPSQVKLESYECGPEPIGSAWIRFPIGFYLVALVFIVFGTRIADGLASTAGIGVSFQVAWAVVSWAVVIASAFLAFACTYYFAPDVDQEFRWIRFGSLAAVAMWLAFTLAFSVYVNYLSAPEETYGALAGIAVFMLYLYGSTFIVLLGAEMNQVLEDAHPEGKDDGQKVAAPNPEMT